jgi:hypothetical protein
MRIFVYVVLLTLSSLILGSPVRAYTLSPQLAAKLTELKCVDLFVGSLEFRVEAQDDAVLAMFFPWAPDVYRQLLQEVIIDKTIPKWQTLNAEAFFAGSTSLSAAPRSKQIIDHRLTSIAPLVLADAQTYGTPVCDVMRVQAAFGGVKLYKLQKATSLRVLPYVAIAQALLTVAGCDIGTPDGSIGPKTLSAWSKLFPGERLGQLVAAGPSWLFKLYEMGVGVPTCNNAALRSSNTEMSLRSIAALYAIHKAALLQPLYGSCELYRAALATYAAETNNIPPDAALARWLNQALKELKDTLHCLDEETDPNNLRMVWDMFFKRGVLSSVLASSPAATRFQYAQLLLSPVAEDREYAQSAVGLLTGIATSAPRAAPPTKQLQSDERSDDDEGDVVAAAASILAWAYEVGVGAEQSRQESEKWQFVARRNERGDDYPWQLNQQGFAYDDQLSANALDAHASWLISELGFKKASKGTLKDGSIPSEIGNDGLFLIDGGFEFEQFPF